MSECKPTEVDRLAQIIRTADGNHDMGAGALAERDNRVRADERAKLQDRIEELEKNLSYEVEQKIKLADTLRDERAKRPDLPCDGGCNVNDGPMEECSHHGRTPRDLWGIIEDLIQRLAAERAKALDAHKCDEQAERAYRRAVAAEQALRDERAKRPDREQIDRIQFEIDNVHQIHGDTCLCGFKSSRSRSRTEHLTALFAEAVLALEPEAREERRPSRVLNEYDDSTTRGLRRGEEVLRQLEHHWAADSATQAIEELLRLRRIVEAREEQGQVEWGVAYRQNDGKLFVDEAVDYDDAVFRVANSSVYDTVVQRRVSAYAPVGAAPAPEVREVTDAAVVRAVVRALVAYGYSENDLRFDPGVRMRAALEAAREVE